MRIVFPAACLLLMFGSESVQAQSAASPAPPLVPADRTTPRVVPALEGPAAKVPPVEVAKPASAPAAAEDPEDVMPPVKDRGTAENQRLIVHGFDITGVGDHPEYGITPASIKRLADAEYFRLATEDVATHNFVSDPVRQTFAQLQGVADKITDLYKKAGFIVARAYVPAQTVGEDKIVRIDVLEGEIGKIIVKGTSRYRPSAIAKPAEKLKGRPLVKDEVDSALLYDRDLPGVAISATFQPGETTGQTDLVIIANEPKRPVQVTFATNNYGTEFTGRYREQLGLSWYSPLGLGDQFDIKGEYALDPSNNFYGSVGYRVPVPVTPGFGVLAGATRNELRINTGSFAAIDIKGPTVNYFGGADWKFVNTVALQLQSQFLVNYEQSKLDSAGGQLSDEKFYVAALTFSADRTDRRFNGVDLVEFGIRKSLSDESEKPDNISPDHDRDFTLAQLNYTRLQFLTKSQRLYAKFVGQYTTDALIPLEQFSIGGPDSVRAYPIADALRDRGYYTALEYHVDAPFFGDVASPFYGRPWRELLEFSVFADYAKGYGAGANKFPDSDVELSGVGAGLTFRIPRFYQLLFNLQGALPLSPFQASDGDDFHIYGQLSFAF